MIAADAADRFPAGIDAAPAPAAARPTGAPPVRVAPADGGGRFALGSLFAYNPVPSRKALFPFADA
jgi:hypothetical protein